MKINVYNLHNGYNSASDPEDYFENLRDALYEAQDASFAAAKDHKRHTPGDDLDIYVHGVEIEIPDSYDYTTFDRFVSDLLNEDIDGLSPDLNVYKETFFVRLTEDGEPCWRVPVTYGTGVTFLTDDFRKCAYAEAKIPSKVAKIFGVGLYDCWDEYRVWSQGNNTKRAKMCVEGKRTITSIAISAECIIDDDEWSQDELDTRRYGTRDYPCLDTPYYDDLRRMIGAMLPSAIPDKVLVDSDDN